VAGRTDTEPPFRRFWIERGRGAAKSFDISVMATWALAFSSWPVKGVVAAGDKDQASLIRSSIERLVSLNRWLAEILTLQADKIIATRSGAELVIISSDIQTSFGLLVDFAIVDELANWKDNAQPLWESLFSTIGKRNNSLLIVITNSGFTQSWQWPLREQVRTDPDWMFRRLDGFAAWITQRAIDEQRRILPAAVFARLWENTWIDQAGDCLTAADIAASVTLPGPASGREDDFDYFCGLDIGTVQDHTGLALLGKRRGDGFLKLCRIMSWAPPLNGEVNLQLVEDCCAHIHQQFSPQFLFDLHEARFMRQRLVNRGLRIEPVYFGGSGGMEMASGVIEVFNSRQIALFRHDDLLADLRALRIKQSPTGYRLDPPKTVNLGHGDRAIALALAILGARRYSLPGTATEMPVAFGGPSWSPVPQDLGGVAYRDEQGRTRRLSTYEAPDEFDDHPFVSGRRPWSG
jgi:hypothetical protein